jgi:hypothetical protein
LQVVSPAISIGEILRAASQPAPAIVSPEVLQSEGAVLLGSESVA